MQAVFCESSSHKILFPRNRHLHDHQLIYLRQTIVQVNNIRVFHLITNTSHAAEKCNLSLWNFIANPPGRFKVINQCVTVTGVVLSVQYELDVDTDFSLETLDPAYKNMVTKSNFNPLMRGGIWLRLSRGM